MSRAAILRAAGAYAEEKTEYLGLLALKASVSAGMRIRDDIRYAPDRRLMPRDSRILARELRSTWMEFEGIVLLIKDFVEQSDAIDFPPPSALFDCSWSDALSLARIAAFCRSEDPLCQVTLSTNWYRSGHRAEASDCLDTPLKIAFRRGSAAGMILRNKANLAWVSGDPDGAFKFATLAWECEPSDPVFQMDWLSYATDESSFRAALEEIQQVDSEVGVRALAQSWSPSRLAIIETVVKRTTASEASARHEISSQSRQCSKQT